MIAETREELSNVVFRRGFYGRSTEAKERRSSKLFGRHIKKETVSSLENNIVTSNYTESTEYFCTVPSSAYQNQDEDTEQKYEPEKVVNTVFGKRLRKKLTEQQELEQIQKEQKKEQERLAREEEAIKTLAITEANKGSAIDNKENQSQCEKVPSLSSTDILNSSNNASASSKHRAILVHKHERKRINNEEGNKEDCKRIKLVQDRSEYNRRQRYMEKLTNSHSDQSQSANQYQHAKKDSRDDWKFNEIGESSIAEDSEYKFNSLPTEERKNNHPDDIVSTNAKTTDDKHIRVTSRLMLLAEGIDPDRSNIPYIDRSKRLSEIKRDSSLDDRNRSRSRDRELRHDKGRRYRSRSRSQEKRYDRRPIRSRDERYRSSRDRFEKRRDYRNKDGDSLSEFSREICDLRERIENKCGEDRDSKDSHSSKNRKHESRPKKDRSKSRDSNTNSGIDKGGKQSRVSNKIISDNTRITSSNCTRDESSRKLKLKAFNKSSKDKNAETVSLQSLEDGEILDTPNSSPKKASSCKIKNPIDCRKESSKNPIDVNVDNANIHKDCDNSIRNVTEEVSSKCSDYHLNSSKDERIENIELFIQNYDSNEAQLELASTDLSAVEKETKLTYSAGNIEDVLEKSGSEIIENIGNSAHLSESCGKLELECIKNMKGNKEINTTSTITDNYQYVKIQSSANDAVPLQKEQIKLKEGVKNRSSSPKCLNHIDDKVPNSKSGMHLLQSTYFGNKNEVMLTDTNSSNHQIILEHEVNQENSVNNNSIVRSLMNCDNQANIQEEYTRTIDNNKNLQDAVEQFADNSLMENSMKKIDANNKIVISKEIDDSCKNHTAQVENQSHSNENELNITSDDIVQPRKINDDLEAIKTIAVNNLDKSESSSTDSDTDSGSEDLSDASNISNASELNHLSDEPEDMKPSKKVVCPIKSTSANKNAPVTKKVLVKSPKKQCKVIVVARRRKPVQLSDTPASMTVVLTTNSANHSACTSKNYDVK
ncbi:uncharacterized protein DDB_G0283697 isoform X2 [Cephus cinctus]|nr:uncharacterized protein DDB_G0283697 isoform X2 [Cephus cinctus]XP_024943360.1 uncharacterized protein DDB_G0283697 isoform X2 [Cephus cinctus]